ncbi:MAG: outer membrane protein assembly factor BamD [Bacteroidales bacterium]|nr:outer membrane protein assembly factor BamD [Bacteroidales bacterium]
MFKKVLTCILTITFTVALISCSKYQRIQKNQDYQYKYEKAIEYYDKEDYYRALNLFDQVMPFFRGTKEAETISYKYAYAYYNQKDYILASYYFDRFAKTFPRSDKAEECAFMTAYCKYLDSPIYKLDQTNTIEAIKGLQLFANAYPNSERIEQCNELIDELRAKLQKKEFEIAKLYLKMDRYKAAVTSFENLLKEYPETEFREEAMFYSIKAYYFYASKSVKSKRKERYFEAVDIYNDFVIMYPDSDFNKDVEYMYNRAIKEMEN